jgi:hypothetical protein
MRPTNSQENQDSLIKPGASVGRLKLGDALDRTRQIFPFKSGVDEEAEESDSRTCGKEYLWVDLENEKRGNVFVRFQDSAAFQIEAATTRFHTREGIKPLDSPSRVRSYPAPLRAYALLSGSPMALGGGPLIYWVDWENGIAFCFAATRKEQERYLYSIAVFKPHEKFCPHGETTDSPDWHELKPYSLEPSTRADGKYKGG